MNSKQPKPIETIEERASIRPLEGPSSISSGELPLDPQSVRQSARGQRASSIMLVALIGGIVALLLASPSSFKNMTGAAANVSRQIAESFAQEPRGKDTALLVENNATRRNLTEIALQHQGYKVLIARNRKQALEIVQQRPEAIALIVVPRRMFDNALMVPGAQVLITD